MASSNSTATNLLYALGAGIIFSVATTNCIVYARGTTSSGNDSTVTGVSEGCASLMTFLNVVIAILSFIYFLYYLYSAIVSPQKQAYYREKVEQTYREQDQKLTDAATAAAVATTKPREVYVV
jgi:hypothetical protein